MYISLYKDMFQELNNQFKQLINTAYNKEPTYYGYTTNNKHESFPPLMQDGRSIISSWQPEYHLNQRLIKDNNIRSNWEYRAYLQTNAKAIMDSNFRLSSNDTGFTVNPEYKSSIESNKLSNIETYPYSYKSIMDDNRPKGYVLSDLKSDYLTREQLDGRRIAPNVHIQKK